MDTEHDRLPRFFQQQPLTPDEVTFGVKDLRGPDVTSPIVARVIDEPITSECVPSEFSTVENGAELVFWGVVRKPKDGKYLVAVTYDALDLAERTLREIGEEACARWGDHLRVVIVHRVGRVPVGEASVIVCVSSPDRDEAFDASRYVIDQIEVRAPIWKQEHYVDGDGEWVEARSLRQAPRQQVRR